MSEPSDPENRISILVEELPPAQGRPRRMLDRYEVIAEIAKGGMGTVYLARREGAGGFERLSAIKLLHEHLAEDESFVHMLLDEARTAANIHHPNAVGIDDVVESPLGHYLVMAYVDGFNLAQIVAHKALTERERIRLATRLLVDAAQGLHAAHNAKNAKGERLGIVHRDVSPQNVLVGTDGVGRIVDFGIALAASRVQASRPGTLKGKPQYMAPEQARGEPCDPRTDVFALGVVLWEALTFERLFYGEMDVAILVQVMDCVVPDPVERNPNVPRGLADVALKALQKSQVERYGSAREFGAALERAATEAGLLASTAEVEETLARVFHEEIAIKAEAVRRHLASSTGAIEPLQKGQLGLVPRLLPKKLTPKRAEMPTRASGVRERDADELALAATQHTPAPSANTPPPVLTPITGTTGVTAPAAPTPQRAGLLGVAIGLGGLVLFALAAAIWFFGGSSSTPEVATAPAPSAVAPSAPTPEAEAIAPQAARAEAEVPAATIEPEAAAEPAPVAPPTPEAVAAPAREHHGRAHTGAPTAAPAPTTAPTTPAPAAAPTGLTIESNPYLTH
jgi:serine/threonine-protein kinase